MIGRIFGFEDGEKTIIEVRKHWFLFASYVFVIALLAIAPFVLFFVVKYFADIPFEFSFSGNENFLVQFFYSLWLLVLWVALFVRWTDYYLDVMIVTSKRIIDIDQKGIFHREVSSLRYENIQDITTEVSGFVGTIMNFGDLHIQTASKDREIKIRGAANPDKAKKIISEIHSGISKKV